MEMTQKALTIAGSDCSGGAGIQADLKTFSAHGVYGMSVITAVVAENTYRVSGIMDVTPDMIDKQIRDVFEDIEPDAVKIGMLNTIETMATVADALKIWQPKNVVIDPVMYAKNGSPLMALDAIETLIQLVVPLATLITPNIPEAEKISGLTIVTVADMAIAARKIHEMGCQAVLIKGGHASGDATDVLYDGTECYQLTRQRIQTKNTHGTGCTLSSAIASNLALGHPMPEAVRLAKDYVTGAIIHALPFGRGNGPTHHFHDLYKERGEKKMTKLTTDMLENVRKTKPLIHHLTNYVTVNDCANITLGIGASPIMAEAIEEAADMAQISQALVINIGTLNSRTVPAMLAAGKAANTVGIPVILDPVGAGASAFRNETVRQLLSEVNFSVIRGNISEIKFIAGLDVATKGVDASDHDLQNIDETASLAKSLAKQLETVIAITGAVDVISDGQQVITIANGHPKLAAITGTGCMCTSLIGAYCGGNPDTIFEATATAILSMGIAGEIAFEKAGKGGNGQFHAAIQDGISLLTETMLQERARVTID